MPFASGLTFVGVAKETTKGTGVVPTFYVPIKQFDPVDVQTYFEDNGMRGSMASNYGEILGPVISQIDMGGDVFPDSIGWQLASVCGDVATTGASAPFTTTFALKNSTDGQPGAQSWTDFYGSQAGTPARRYAGQQTSELSLKASADGMFTWSAKTMGFASASVAKPTAAVTAIPPVPSWLMTSTIGGASKTFVEAMECNMKRQTGAIHTLDGTAAPYAIWQGALTVDGKLTLVMEDEVELTRYLAGTPVVLLFDLTQGAAAALVDVNLQMSKVQYTVGNIKRAKDYIQLDMTYAAVANTTDVGASGGYSPIKATVKNALAASTYV